MERPNPNNNWEEYQEYFNRKLIDIYIPSEIQPGEIKALTSRLNSLYDEIFLDFVKFKSMYENIEDLIDEVRSRNLDGSNSEERRKRGYDAAANYSNEKGAYNLFDLRRKYREKYNFARAVIDSINGKKSSLITDSAVLKIEASLLS